MMKLLRFVQISHRVEHLLVVCDAIQAVFNKRLEVFRQVCGVKLGLQHALELHLVMIKQTLLLCNKLVEALLHL